MNFRPMLAPRESPDSFPDFFQMLTYPLDVSPKIDGIRGTVKAGIVQSRTFKPHPNRQVQEMFGGLEHADGELTFGEPTGHDVMNRAASSVRAINTVGDFRFYIFDYTPGNKLMEAFEDRLEMAKTKFKDGPGIVLPHTRVDDYDELIAQENIALAAGYEGLMMRNPWGYYKNNRATMKDALIWKLKRFQDGEFICVAVHVGRNNVNEVKENALGYAERSTHKANMVESDMVGSYEVLDMKTNTTFIAGASKMTHDQRRAHLQNPHLVVGELLNVRFFGYTADGVRRFPSVMAIRDSRDI